MVSVTLFLSSCPQFHLSERAFVSSCCLWKYGARARAGGRDRMGPLFIAKVTRATWLKRLQYPMQVYLLYSNNTQVQLLPQIGIGYLMFNLVSLVSYAATPRGKPRDDGTSSSFWRMVTLSGKCLLGPRLPDGSCGNIILTLIPSTPCRSSTWRTAVSTYSLVGSPAWIIQPSTNFIDLARWPRSLPETTTSQPFAPDSIINLSTP